LHSENNKSLLFWRHCFFISFMMKITHLYRYVVTDDVTFWKIWLFRSLFSSDIRIYEWRLDITSKAYMTSLHYEITFKNRKIHNTWKC